MSEQIFIKSLPFLNRDPAPIAFNVAKKVICNDFLITKQANLAQQSGGERGCHKALGMLVKGYFDKNLYEERRHLCPPRHFVSLCGLLNLCWRG
jgi:hypothetical protein